MKKYILCCTLIFSGCGHELSKNPKGLKTENIILITLDGIRWEDLFYGANEKIVLDTLFVKDVESTHAQYWSEDYLERRKLVFPFIWNTVGQQGQIYGNKEQGSVMRSNNPYWFSYPGYNELLVGFNDDSVNSNEKEWNPNINLLEFLDQQEGLEDRVAAFASWDVFDWIINTERNDFTINSGGYPFYDEKLTPKQQWLNTFIEDAPSPWYGSAVRWDAFTFEYAFEYLKLNKPRFLYISFDETDEFAHQREYDKYLNTANRSDGYIKAIWDWTQSNEMYRGKTTMMITTDHGRGGHEDGAWGSHGDGVPGAEFLWTAIIGPDTPAIGEMTNTDTIATSQLAATLGYLLGYDFISNQPVGHVVDPMVGLIK